MSTPVKTRPERYRDRSQAIAYHASTGQGRPNLSQRLELAAVRRALAAAEGGSTALDAPCGTGRIDALLRERFDRVTGLDSSAPMLSVYLQDEHRSAGVCGDIFNLPFDDEAFDWTICHRYFHHLHSHPERASLLASLRRVSRCGVIFYAWVNTPLVRRKASMRASIPASEVNRAVFDSGLVVKNTFPCAGPFSVKRLVLCTCPVKTTHR